MASDVLDTIRGVGYIAQLQLDDGSWVSWTQYTTEHGRTPEKARELARTLVLRKLEEQGVTFLRGRVVRADWVIEEVVDLATNPEGCPVRSSVSDQPCLLPVGHEAYRPDRFHKYAPRAGEDDAAKNLGLEESGGTDER